MTVWPPHEEMRHPTTMSKYIEPKANTHNLVKFQTKYGTEESCEQALFQLPEGFKHPNATPAIVLL